MSNDKSLLGTLLEKGDLPGITQNDVVNQAHPGYFEPIGERNMGQENLAAMGVELPFYAMSDKQRRHFKDN